MPLVFRILRSLRRASLLTALLFSTFRRCSTSPLSKSLAISAGTIQLLRPPRAAKIESSPVKKPSTTSIQSAGPSTAKPHMAALPTAKAKRTVPAQGNTLSIRRTSNRYAWSRLAIRRTAFSNCSFSSPSGSPFQISMSFLRRRVHRTGGAKKGRTARSAALANGKASIHLRSLTSMHRAYSA